MYKNKIGIIKDDKISALAMGIVIGIIIVMAMLFIFAFIYTVTNINEYYNAVFVMVSLGIGSFFGAKYSVNKIKEKGFINGSIVGLFIFLIVFIISVFISENSISLTSVFHFTSCVLSGGISGIIYVNKETNKKYLK